MSVPTSVTELLDFTGGINNVVAPHLLPINEALNLVNVDINFGSLKSVAELSQGQYAASSHFIDFNNKLYYYNEWRANARIDNKLYWTDGITQGKILDDGTELPLGIGSPTQVLTQNIIGNIGEGVHKGDFKYTYTFYSSTTGVESAPSLLPSYIYANEQNIDLINFQPLPPEADRYRLYRIGGYLSQFTLVATLDASEAVAGYLDSLDETVIDGRLLQTLRTGTPPTNIKNFVELNGRLFGSVGSKVYFSGLGAPDSWYSDDFFTMPDTVVALAKASGGLLVMGKTYVQLILGESPATFRQKVISDYLGCIAAESVAQYADKPIWLGVDGLYTSDGYSILNLTHDKIENIKNIEISSAVVANNVYYLAYKPTIYPKETLYPSEDLYPGGTKGTGTSDSSQGIIALDFRRGQGYSYHVLDYEASVSIGVYRSEVHVVLYNPKLKIQCNDTISCDDVFCTGNYSLAKLTGLDSDNLKRLHYLSPELIDNTLATLKEFDKVRINFKGEFNVKVIFSDLQTIVEQDIKSVGVIRKAQDIINTAEEVAIIGIPNDKNKSFFIAFLIEGIGVINSIQYSWKTRELP